MKVEIVLMMVLILLSTLMFPLSAQRKLGSSTLVPSSSPSQSSGRKKKLILGVSIGVSAGVFCLLCGICGYYLEERDYKRRQKYNSSLELSESSPNILNNNDIKAEVANGSQEGVTVTQKDAIMNETARERMMKGTKERMKERIREKKRKNSLITPESLEYKLGDLQAATDNFSKDNKIGRGGFGFVYKGILVTGQQVAVKRLSHGSGQGEKEFQTEVVLLAKLQHRNLVRLLGYCLDGDEALLVYEFVTNKSLDYFLFDNKGREELNWPCRLEIIKGVARGMMYLHEDSPLRTMHRDLKAGNVLLDANMCPKIADFGLARICDIEQTHIIPTRVVGTHGYMAPEYLFHGQFSVKSDVYAFGVLVLEIICGRRIGSSISYQSRDESLISYVWRCWEDETPLDFIDPIILDSNSFSSDEVIKCVQLGLLCVQENGNVRPTMSTIVHTLNSNYGCFSLAMPQHPAFIYSGSSH